MSDTLGSQRLLQRAVNAHPDLLHAALTRAGVLDGEEAVRWTSPISADGYTEYRDMEAFRRLELREPLTVPLADFWPRRGPVWDGLGVTTAGTAILLEAKAHIPEAVSPKTMASAESLKKIRASLEAARSILAPRSTTDWCVNFYQYANRLAFHLFLSRTNGLPSKLVFLYFTHAVAMGGPSSEEEWHGATRLIHAVLGVPADLRRYGVYDAFLDARELTLEA